MGNSTGYQHPGRLFVARYGPITIGPDVIKFASFLRQEANLGDEPPIDLSAIFHRFGIVSRRIPLQDQAGLLLDPDTGMIFINEDDPTTRQRFSEAHELMELLFPVQVQSESWGARYLFSESGKEKLCEEGAAELLMPLSTFRSYVNQWGVSLETGERLAKLYNVSLTAALLRIVRFGPGQHALVLWRLAHKPIEERTMPHPEQLSLFGDYIPQPPPKKLRVQWGCSTRDKLYIPRCKSIEFDTSIYKAYEQGLPTRAVDWIDLKAFRGHCFCESMTVTIGTERCVLSVIHIPGDEHSIFAKDAVNHQ